MSSRFNEVDKELPASTSRTAGHRHVVLTAVVRGIQVGLGRIDLAGDLDVVVGRYVVRRLDKPAGDGTRG